MNCLKNVKTKSLKNLQSSMVELEREKLVCELKKIRRAKAIQLKSVGVCI